MTIIVAFNNALVADSVGSICGTPIVTTKIHRLPDGALWGMAGEQPTHGMMTALTMKELIEAFAASPSYLKRSVVVSIDGTSIWQTSYVGGECTTAIMEPGMAIGCYQGEYHARRTRNEALETLGESHGYVDPMDLALNICKQVNELWGVACECQFLLLDDVGVAQPT